MTVLGTAIPLYRGSSQAEIEAEALIDAQLLGLICGVSEVWRVMRVNGRQYARAVDRREGKEGRLVLLHRLVAGLEEDEPCPGMRVRFRNRNTLDCRRANLEIFRAVPLPEREKLRRKARTEQSCQSPYRNVFWDPAYYDEQTGRIGGWYGVGKIEGKVLETRRFVRDADAHRAAQQMSEVLGA